MCICSASTESESSDVPCEWFTPHTSKIPSDDLNKHPKSTWDHESSETVTMTSSSNNSLRDTVKYRPSDDQVSVQLKTQFCQAFYVKHLTLVLCKILILILIVLL